jgi:hypothetical protein
MTGMRMEWACLPLQGVLSAGVRLSRALRQGVLALDQARRAGIISVRAIGNTGLSGRIRELRKSSWD